MKKRININLPNRFIKITDLDFLAENENISDDVWVLHSPESKENNMYSRK